MRVRVYAIDLIGIAWRCRFPFAGYFGLQQVEFWACAYVRRRDAGLKPVWCWFEVECFFGARCLSMGHSCSLLRQRFGLEVEQLAGFGIANGNCSVRAHIGAEIATYAVAGAKRVVGRIGWFGRDAHNCLVRCFTYLRQCASRAEEAAFSAMLAKAFICVHLAEQACLPWAFWALRKLEELVEQRCVSRWHSFFQVADALGERAGKGFRLFGLFNGFYCGSCCCVSCIAQDLLQGFTALFGVRAMRFIGCCSSGYGALDFPVVH